MSLSKDWRPTRFCAGCERQIVMLISPNDPQKTIPVYNRSWDGTPVFDPGLGHRRHPVKKRCNIMLASEREGG